MTAERQPTGITAVLLTSLSKDYWPDIGEMLIARRADVSFANEAEDTTL